MIKIEKFPDIVKVYHPITTITFNRDRFDLLCENIYLITRKSTTSKEIVRKKGNIEELNAANWLCIHNRFNAIYNDITTKSVDVDYLIQKGII